MKAILILAALALSGCANTALIQSDLQTTYTDAQALDSSPPALKVKADITKLVTDVKASQTPPS